MALIRKPTESEKRLLEYLIGKASKPSEIDWKNLLVSSMNDGEMGSILLFPLGKVKEGREFLE